MNSRILALSLITGLALCTGDPVATGASDPESGALPPCDPQKNCCPEVCPDNVELPDLSLCLEDSCACARQLDCYLEQQDIDTWPIFPQSEEKHLNTGATHGRFITSRVNDPALESITAAIGNPDRPTVLARGSIIAKQNFLVDPDNPKLPLIGSGSPFLTVMYKLEGYCPEGARQANGDCAGGEWFWYLKRFGRFPFTGKDNFCLDCHGAADDGDWAWQVELFRRFPNNTENGVASAEGGAR